MNRPTEQLTPRTLRFELPEPTVLMNQWQRWHWAKRRRYAKRLSWLVLAATRQRGRQPFQRCHVEIERYSSGTPDIDGIVGGCKPLMDCLVLPSRRNPHGLGIIEDDNPNCVLSLVARPMPAAPNEGRTVVLIREAT